MNDKDAAFWVCPACGFGVEAFEPRPEAQLEAIRHHMALHESDRDADIREQERQRLADLFETERLAVLAGPHPTAQTRIIASVLRDVVAVLRFNEDGLTQDSRRYPDDSEGTA